MHLCLAAGCILTGHGDSKVQDQLLLDVAPLSMVIETAGHVMTHSHLQKHHHPKKEGAGQS